ncbi:hypothetical protein [Pseudoalteromonas sp. S16_S37]|uniref:hypothetical protein n=1 Tax=Pseudoalteromonas sp. S16_S37 TaxID=2720228 RepID=UPI001681678E|nr:hypothetical protein [Pseudoalteromonas sp. S16_S37]MBD1583246.1 hypothetical protein [Pseudoalteromonas sp. S16_S37]
MLVTLFGLHLIRGCTFSPTARRCAYIVIATILLNMMQIVARVYFDYHELNIVYLIGGLTCNFAMVASVSIYPVREFKNYIKQKRATE